MVEFDGRFLSVPSPGAMDFQNHDGALGGSGLIAERYALFFGSMFRVSCVPSAHAPTSAEEPYFSVTAMLPNLEFARACFWL